MNHKFKAGDLVVLRAGGPKMVVDEISPGGGIWAVWFAGAKRERAHFSADTLDPAPAEEKKK